MVRAARRAHRQDAPARPSWTLPARLSPQALGSRGHGGAERLLGLVARRDRPGSRRARRSLSRRSQLIARRLERFGTGAERFGLVHADLRLANLLVDGRHLRIIDFDDCGFSWFMYDFATAVSFIEHEPMVPQLLRAWCSRLSAEPRRCRPRMRAEIATFVVLRRILLTRVACLARGVHLRAPVRRSLHHRHGDARAAASARAISEQAAVI